jgi:uncharacterized repeat protein (TIGR03806 family)
MRYLLGLLPLVACGGGAPYVPIDGKPPAMLSELHLLDDATDGFVTYSKGVVPYDLNTPLFSDYAIKERAIYLPDGTTAAWRDNAVLHLPVGSAILKTFIVPADLRAPDDNRRIVETRLMIRYPDEWKNWPYVWNADGTDAELQVEGMVEEMEIVDLDGITRPFSYLVPQRNQCQECHELKGDDGENFITPIGPKPRNLNRDYAYADGDANQLEHLVELGLLDTAPDVADVGAAVPWKDYLAGPAPADLPYETVDRVARDYLDINCAHCHNPAGVSGITSQLFLNWDNLDRFHLGICKKPGSAAKGTGGRHYDLVPGSYDDSILHYRIDTDDIGSMMPQLGRSLVHNEGVDLIRTWIDGLPDAGCDPSEE